MKFPFHICHCHLVTVKFEIEIDLNGLKKLNLKLYKKLV